MGMLHIYCGDGKGKTTAALGLALRAAGSGMKVHIVQLMKGRFTSELNVISLIDNITIERCDKDYGFVRNMTKEEKRSIRECHNKMLANAFQMVKNSSIDMLILDEFNSAYEHELLDIEYADEFILTKDLSIELILTGRNPNKKFIYRADYVSEIRAIKHPYRKGVIARLGIEY